MGKVQFLSQTSKILKYYENDDLQNFLLFSMSLLSVPIAKNSHILARIYFNFIKSTLDQFWKYQIWTSVERSEK